MNKNLNKYKEAFLTEAEEHLGGMNRGLLNLEKNPAKMEWLNDIFREAHTLKSMAATMNYHQTAGLCHALEDVLQAIKTKKITLDQCIDTLFESFDAIESSLKEIVKDKEEPDMAGLAARLEGLVEKGHPGHKTDHNHDHDQDQDQDQDQDHNHDHDHDQDQDHGQDQDQDIDRDPDSSLIPPTGSVIEKVSSIQVKVDQLDRLMNLTEELVINKMRLDTIKESLKHPELTAAMDNLTRLVSELQYNVVQSRMVPIGFVFNRFPRMVRDLAKQQKKEVNLKMEGVDLALDKVVLDEIAEPLVHLLRNAVDHGLETPKEREKAGKPPQGTIRLSAKRTANLAIIEVSDDGAGLSLEKIKTMAIKEGLLSEDASEEEIRKAIFSGLSTTKQITPVSGRGLGLSIVKNKIESLGGMIRVESVPGKKTTMIMSLPLTLAIIKALFIEVRNKLYAIPLVNVKRTITVNVKEIKGLMNEQVINQSEGTIPTLRLDLLFGHQPLIKEKQTIVIINKDEQGLGLVVDGLLDTREIVVKPLNKLVRDNRYFSGSTITGSGEVVLILDAANLILSRGWPEEVVNG